MAKFINTRKAVSEIEDLIKNAGERLFLVSPYLKLSKDFKELLNYRNGKDKVTTIIFGKQELNPDEMKFLQNLRFVNLKYHEDLHAKCYLNDDRMVITSLNLYAFSMANNKEMGVVIDRNDPADVQLYDDAFKEVSYINETSERFELNIARIQPAVKQTDATEKPDKMKSNLLRNKETGYCIRTGIEIPFNVLKPLSSDAFKKWNEFANVEYPEKYCHFSGESSNSETSVSKPILKKNWKKAKEVFNF